MARFGRSFPMPRRQPTFRQNFFQIALSEAITVTTSMGRSIIKIFNNAITVTEGALLRSITKVFTIPVTVTVNMNRSIIKAFSESMTVADSFTTALVVFVILNEAVTISDSMARGIHKNFIIPVSVAATMQLSITRLYSEAIAVTDSIVVGLARAFATAILVSESILRGIGKTFTNAVTVTPVLNYIQSFSVHLTDFISSSISFNLGVTKGLTESIRITERLRRYKNGIEILYEYYYRVKNTIYNAYKYLTQNTSWTDKY